jgi:hypothetical protein
MKFLKCDHIVAAGTALSAAFFFGCPKVWAAPSFDDTIPPEAVTSNAFDSVEAQVEDYVALHGHAPKKLADLPATPNGQDGRKPVDGWGNELIYTVQSDGSVVLGSAGKKGGSNAHVVRFSIFAKTDDDTKIAEMDTFSRMDDFERSIRDYAIGHHQLPKSLGDLGADVRDRDNSLMADGWKQTIEYKLGANGLIDLVSHGPAGSKLIFAHEFTVDLKNLGRHSTPWGVQPTPEEATQVAFMYTFRDIDTYLTNTKCLPEALTDIPTTDAPMARPYLREFSDGWGNKLSYKAEGNGVVVLGSPGSPTGKVAMSLRYSPMTADNDALAQQYRTVLDLIRLAQLIDDYAVAHRGLPKSLADLPPETRVKNADLTTDGWDRPVLYRVRGDGSIVLSSCGPTGNKEQLRLEYVPDFEKSSATTAPSR